ncbi:hypothetical protein QUF54_03295 [Candidatus Marithioploca araucensis]|uniref:Uncharacterized protein n=1 Tax=Candidatus Marithioploca araucensis TaxID=70273 RepID=A0ABT7VRR5_9GAMM|nr:hypothetical protein [Candidatus Marithioploca araucensis]
MSNVRYEPIANIVTQKWYGSVQEEYIKHYLTENVPENDNENLECPYLKKVRAVCLL